jgi:hypothetical protein
MAIRTFMEETNDRHRLRSNGRPLLTMLAEHIAARCAAGGSVTLQHTSSHKDAATAESTGNACADFWADRMRELQQKTARQRQQLAQPQLDIARGERLVFFRDAAMECVISDDVRRAAKHRQQYLNLRAWQHSQSQAMFACDQVVELARWVIKKGSPEQVRLLFLMISNTIHLSVQPVSALSSSDLTASSSSSSSSSRDSQLSVLSQSDGGGEGEDDEEEGKEEKKVKKKLGKEQMMAWCSECGVCMNISHVLLECPRFNVLRERVMCECNQMLDRKPQDSSLLAFLCTVLHIAPSDTARPSSASAAVTARGAPFPLSSSAHGSLSSVSSVSSSSCVSCSSSLSSPASAKSMPAFRSLTAASSKPSPLLDSLQFAVPYSVVDVGESVSPVPLLARWAFGGISMEEFRVYMQRFFNQKGGLREAFEEFRQIFFSYACDVAAIAFSHLI